MSKAVDVLKKHEAKQPSKFAPNAQERDCNSRWLAWSHNVALRLIRYMEDEDINRQQLATRVKVTPQYISKILSGNVNFSFKTICDLENKLDIELITIID